MELEFTSKKLVKTGILTEREWKLITNCINYTRDEPAGLPGHNVIILVTKLFFALETTIHDFDSEQIQTLIKAINMRMDEVGPWPG